MEFMDYREDALVHVPVPLCTYMCTHENGLSVPIGRHVHVNLKVHASNGLPGQLHTHLRVNSTEDAVCSLSFPLDMYMTISWTTILELSVL